MIVNPHMWKVVAYQTQPGHIGKHYDYVHHVKTQQDQQDKQVASAARKQCAFKLYIQ